MKQEMTWLETIFIMMLILILYFAYYELIKIFPLNLIVATGISLLWIYILTIMDEEGK